MAASFDSNSANRLHSRRLRPTRFRWAGRSIPSVGSTVALQPAARYFRATRYDPEATTGSFEPTTASKASDCVRSAAPASPRRTCRRSSGASSRIARSHRRPGASRFCYRGSRPATECDLLISGTSTSTRRSATRAVVRSKADHRLQLGCGGQRILLGRSVHWSPDAAPTVAIVEERVGCCRTPAPAPVAVCPSVGVEERLNEAPGLLDRLLAGEERGGLAHHSAAPQRQPKDTQLPARELG